jgi:hypothetical protein
MTPADTARVPGELTVVSVEMGYGHLRAALPLADQLSTTLMHADLPPLAAPRERRLWEAVRRGHEIGSKLSQLRGVFTLPLQSVMDVVTMIPSLHGSLDLTRPNAAVRYVDFLMERGLGAGLVEHLRSTGSALLTTFYVPALVAARSGCGPVYCVCTDADIHRVWVPMDPGADTIHYFAPSRRVVRRLQAYGVPAENITFTGFPLPPELLGGPQLDGLRGDLAARVVRLDPEGSFRSTCRAELERSLGRLPRGEERRPPMLTFAVGGAGAQTDLPDLFLPRFRGLLERRAIRITLVAGTRPDVASRLRASVERAGLAEHLDADVQVLEASGFAEYYRRFSDLLKGTDILWTKPSELSFYAALGIPLVVARPIGEHERFNLRWLREHGAGLKQRNPRNAAGWLEEWLADGTLAAAAWWGFTRLPKLGTYEIARVLRGGSPAPARPTEAAESAAG